MRPVHWHPRGLFLKLGLFFLVIAIPALVLVEAGVVWLEFRAFRSAVDAGSMERAVAKQAPALEARLRASSGDRQRMDDALAAWLLRLERPRDGLASDAGFVLLELSSEPFSAAILAPDGRVLGAAPQGREPPRVDRAGLDAIARGAVGRIAESSGPEFMRRYATRLGDEAQSAVLVLELRIPHPWQRIARASTFEWPLMLAFLVLFASATALFVAWYVTRRLHAIGTAAEAWRRGDFSRAIVDPSRDELGRLSAQLNAMAADLEELLAARTTLATLSERARLARDLHDTVKQKAFALSLQLGALEAGLKPDLAGQPPLVEARRLAEEIQRELAQILDELRPTPGEGLGAQLAARAHAFTRESAIGVMLDAPAAADVSPAFHATLLRALDEALSNVLRHSEAREVAVALRREGARFVLEVRDDGRGATGEPAGGRGLGHLRERAQALPGGRFDWHAEPGRGVRLRIAWDGAGGVS